MRTLWILLGAAALLASPAHAQYVDDGAMEDASVLRAGQLRFNLSIFRQFWTKRFGADGNRERWTIDFESPTFGPAAIPTLGPVQDSLRALTGLPSYALSLGASSLEATADLRGSPVRFELGVTNRLTLGVSVPIIRTSVRSALAVDSTANVGWNPLTSFGTDPTAALSSYNDFFDQLGTAIDDLSAGIGGGQFGCPTNCQAAQALLGQATTFRDALFAVLFGGPGMLASPVFPLVGSNAATALSALVAQLQTDFSALSLTGFVQSLLFPDMRFAEADIQNLIISPEFGIAALPLQTFTSWKLGDVALSAKYLVVNGSRYRAAITGIVRLPTGTVDLPDHFFDQPSGDKQLDLEARLYQDFQLSDAFQIATMVRFVYQRPSTLVRRVTPHTAPIAPLSTKTSVERDLGDILQVSVRPTLALTPQVSVSLFGMYHRKTKDKFSFASTSAGVPGVSASVLELDTEEEAWRIGGGVRYHASDRFETGLQHMATFRGSGGLTPNRSQTSVIVRLYFGLWGGGPSASGD